MPRLIAMEVYSVDEACELLAQRTGWPKKFSPPRLYALIEQYLPGLPKVGKRFFLTEVELNIIEKQLQIKKRPRTIDKR